MYIFRFTYQEMSVGSLRTIDFRFDWMGRDEREAYCYAMQKAYDSAKFDECLVSVELMAC